MLHNVEYYQATHLEAETSTHFERIKDEVLTRVHAQVEDQSEAPTVKAIQ